MKLNISYQLDTFNKKLRDKLGVYMTFTIDNGSGEYFAEGEKIEYNIGNRFKSLKEYDKWVIFPEI